MQRRLPRKPVVPKKHRLLIRAVKMACYIPHHRHRHIRQPRNRHHTQRPIRHPHRILPPLHPHHPAPMPTRIQVRNPRRQRHLLPLQHNLHRIKQRRPLPRRLRQQPLRQPTILQHPPQIPNRRLIPTRMHRPKPLRLIKQRQRKKPIQIRIILILPPLKLLQRMHMLLDILNAMLPQMPAPRLLRPKTERIILMIPHQRDRLPRLRHRAHNPQHLPNRRPPIDIIPHKQHPPLRMRKHPIPLLIPQLLQQCPQLRRVPVNIPNQIDFHVYSLLFVLVFISWASAIFFLFRVDGTRTPARPAP